MERIISSIHMGDTFNGISNIYKVGGVVDGSLEVKGIMYKRDGLQSINNRSASESCYLIALVNELNKEVTYKVIPHVFVQEITFIEIEDKKGEDVKVERV